MNTVLCGKAALTSRLSIPRQSWEGEMKLLEESLCCFSVLKRVLAGGGGAPETNIIYVNYNSIKKSISGDAESLRKQLGSVENPDNFVRIYETLS